MPVAERTRDARTAEWHSDAVVTPRAPRRRQTGHFLRHYFEMCIPMCIGFAVGDLVYF